MRFIKTHVKNTSRLVYNRYPRYNIVMAIGYSGINLSKTANLRSRGWTFAVSDSAQFDRLTEYAITVPESFAYITHEPETGESSKHMHFYIEFENDRYLASLSRELELLPNLIEPAKSKQALLKYFLHATEAAQKAGKRQYDVSAIYANFDVEKLLKIGHKGMTHEEYWLICDTVFDYKDGKISKREMMEIMEPVLGSQISKVNLFGQLLKLDFEVKSEVFEHVPTPVMKTMFPQPLTQGLSNCVNGHASKTQLTEEKALRQKVFSFAKQNE